ncbi:MAG: GNAT family N-acetyltransferase [Anaerolineaceae bacterium]|nr:GNAT family N-acetyltransferase [Anaerolineaceae bacterium]
MDILIREIDKNNVTDIGSCDGEFIIDSRLELYMEQGEILYKFVPISPYKKRYKQDDIDYSTYLDDPHKTVYLAYTDGQIAGQIILCNYWNKYAYIEDIAVDIKYRRQGIGRRLILQAVSWAKERGLPGIMLETQDNNAAGCRFY